MMLSNTTRRATSRAAFTLLEVLVVVAILVILAGVGIVATTRYLEDARKSKAQLQAKAIAQACESYKLNSANPTGEYPQSLQELIAPPFGGSSMLQNGMNDLYTPWGNNQQFNYEIRQSQNDQTGSTGFPFVYCTAPDGTPISNFGIGQQKAYPTQ